MKYRTFGKIGWKVSAVGYGAWAIGGTWGRVDDDESLKAIWGAILSWTFELLYENALAQGKKNDADWSKVMKKIKNKK